MKRGKYFCRCLTTVKKSWLDARWSIDNSHAHYTGPYQSAYNEAKGLIMAFRSKGSKKYGPTGTGSFYGKGEGAKETLGMISI